MKTAAQIRRDASDAQIIAARFPNMSKSARELNSGKSEPFLTSPETGKIRVNLTALNEAVNARESNFPKGKFGICAGQFVHEDGIKTMVPGEFVRDGKILHDLVHREPGVNAPDAPPAHPKSQLVLRLTGQVRGGKNGMGVSRTGHHYAKPTFKTWRDDAVDQICMQLADYDPCFRPFTEPCGVRLDYVSGDKRRRDMPAVIDAVWHVLERAGVVQDDCLLWACDSSRSYDKSSPGVTITFL